MAEDLKEVAEFLEQLNLSQYFQTFETNGFERLSDVRLITESDLETMQVLLGHRRRILAAVSSISADSSNSPVPRQISSGERVVTLVISPKTMQIGITRLGTEHWLDVPCSATVYDVCKMIQEKEGMSLDQQRLIFKGRSLTEGDETPIIEWSETIDPKRPVRLWDGRIMKFAMFEAREYNWFEFTRMLPAGILDAYQEFKDSARKSRLQSRKLVDFQVQDKSVLHLVFRLAGDIGTFADHHGSPGVEFLNDALETKMSVQEMTEVVKEVHLRTERVLSEKLCLFGNSFNSHLTPILCESSRQNLLYLVDQSHHDEQDFKLELTTIELVSCIGNEDFQNVIEAFGESLKKIILRRVSAVGQCINFHLDHSKKTMQVPLNEESEYDGGRLVYLTEQGVEVPSRLAGSYTLHDNTIVHGVSRFRCGVRVSLFFLVE